MVKKNVKPKKPARSAKKASMHHNESQSKEAEPIIIEKERLSRIANANRPPQSWFEQQEEDDLFEVQG